MSQQFLHHSSNIHTRRKNNSVAAERRDFTTVAQKLQISKLMNIQVITR